MPIITSENGSSDISIAIVGLGYVGIPLACAFAKYFKVFGYDKDIYRINRLKEGYDHSGELKDLNLLCSPNLTLSSSPNGISDCNVVIIAVPTPITAGNEPSFLNLLDSAEPMMSLKLAFKFASIFILTNYIE